MIFDTEPTQKQLIAGYLMAGLPLLFGFYMAVWGFGQMADKKAQNPENLISGCMYYDGYRKDKHGYYFYYFIIENKRVIHTDLFRDNFFNDLEKHSFYNRVDFFNHIKSNQQKCFVVQYIELDFILFKKIFVYNYHGSS